MARGFVKCFGVGDGWPCSDRNHSSFLYQIDQVNFLIDCGEPISRSFKASGLSYEAFDKIILSHLHFDHVGGLFMFLQGLWLERRTRDLAIHLPAHGIEPIQKMLAAGCIFEELMHFRLRYVPLTAAEPIPLNRGRVTPFPSTHLEQMRQQFGHRYPGVFQAFCFLIESDQLRIGHSADLGWPQDLAPLLTEPLDLLVCELAHFPPEELFCYLRGQPIKRLVLIHLARDSWAKLRETRKLASKILPDLDILFARDLDEVRF